MSFDHGGCLTSVTWLQVAGNRSLSARTVPDRLAGRSAGGLGSVVVGTACTVAPWPVAAVVEAHWSAERTGNSAKP